MDRVIVFCRFDSSDQGQAIGAPEYRLVDLFTACTPGMHTQERTPKNVKDCIIENFCKSGSNLRIVVATIAFGMVWVSTVLISDVSFTGVLLVI